MKPKNKTMLILAMAVAIICTGCGKRIEIEANREGLIQIAGTDLSTSPVAWLTSFEKRNNAGDIDGNYADMLYYESYRKGFGEGPATFELGFETACAKRKGALTMARAVWTYSFKNYGALDGVSGLIYNVGYLCSVPHKIIRGLFCMDGVGCYVGALAKLALGSVCAVVGIVAAPVINTLCHPCETLANLTIGVIYLGDSTGLTYTRYLFNTNLVASSIDLVWGAIIYPLVQTGLFWL